jgi:cytochrome c biogenesis protein CcmG/thiol:disulfide interchange protein DsbE
MMRYALPIGFIALVVVLGVGLSLNPREVPSPLVGKPIPAFDVERLRFPEQRLRDADLKGQVSLVNFWATWCEGCRLEHPLLVRIANESGIPIYGMNYKDERESALALLRQLGDPYVSSGFDLRGDVGLDLGVYGLPETFVVGPDGIIAYKQIGPITEQDWRDKILPVVRALGAR